MGELDSLAQVLGVTYANQLGTADAGRPGGVDAELLPAPTPFPTGGLPEVLQGERAPVGGQERVRADDFDDR